MFSVIAYNDQKRCRQDAQIRQEMHVLSEALTQFIDNSDVIDPSAELVRKVAIAQAMLDEIDAKIAA
jgi:hypothetical protein